MSSQPTRIEVLRHREWRGLGQGAHRLAGSLRQTGDLLVARHPFAVLASAAVIGTMLSAGRGSRRAEPAEPIEPVRRGDGFLAFALQSVLPWLLPGAGPHDGASGEGKGSPPA